MTTPTMAVCVLVMWSANVQPFMAGEYQDCRRCRASAVRQVIGMGPQIGRSIRWECKIQEK